jgi:hypothetical protein
MRALIGCMILIRARNAGSQSLFWGVTYAVLANQSRGVAPLPHIFPKPRLSDKPKRKSM